MGLRRSGRRRTERPLIGENDGVIVASSRIAHAVKARHGELARIAREMSDAQWHGSSLLPGWSRLTILCHLRYGALASVRMTDDTLSDQPTSYYPLGRSEQRPSTLVPAPQETAKDVVESFVNANMALDRRWTHMGETDWQRTIREPGDNGDLGAIPLANLALLRLTEVEVHGTDLDLGLSRWSDEFVDAAFPMRVHWLPTRRSNRATADTTIEGRWQLAADDGTAFVISAFGSKVSVEEGAVDDAPCTIRGTKHALLGFLLGRVELDTLHVSGDPGVASMFHAAFPSP